MRQWRPQGGPIARDGGEGGAVGAASEQRRKHGVGQRKPAGGGGSTVLKGAGGDAADRGGPGIVTTWRVGMGKTEGGPGCGTRTARTRPADRRARRPRGPVGSDGVRGEHDAAWR
jgi:hypothetical protein